MYTLNYKIKEIKGNHKYCSGTLREDRTENKKRIGWDGTNRKKLASW